MSFGGGTQRPQWYDRTPTTVDQNYQAAVVPHAQTTRWTYTVPANRKAFISNTICSVVRYVVATTPADAFAFVKRSSTYLAWAHITLGDNVVGNKDEATTSGNVTALAGELISAASSDASTGGQCYITIMGTITEFDA